MSSSNRTFVLAYIFLVGVPVLALVGILKSGRQLAAPPSVDGSWKIEARGAGPASACNSFLSSAVNSPLSISQSGASLVVGINGGDKTTMGKLEGKTIKAQFAGTDDAPNCADRNLTLTATLDPQADPRTLQGTLSVANCPACSLDFHASRQPRTAAGGGH